MVAEKLDALVTLGIANSRKGRTRSEFGDLWVLARQADFDGDILTQAIRATFDRRATPLPDGVPFGLTEDFAHDRQKQTQWRAFLAKNALARVLFADVLDLLRGFLMPPLPAAGTGASLTAQWRPGDGWR